MPLSPEDVRAGKCGGVIGCDGRAILTTKFKVKDGEYEYNSFCKNCLELAVEYVTEKSKEPT